jgi:HEAT repeat protein
MSKAPTSSSSSPSRALSRFAAAISTRADEEIELLVAALREEDAPGLAAMIQSSDPDERWWAVRALAHCGGEAQLNVMLAALDDDESSIRAVAALALVRLWQAAPGEQDAILDALARHLADEDGFVRQTAADALAQFGDAAVPALAVVLSGPHDGARARAAYALRKIASYRAAGLLFSLLNDPHPLVRTYAQEGLDDLGLLENVLLIP